MKPGKHKIARWFIDLVFGLKRLASQVCFVLRFEIRNIFFQFRIIRLKVSNRLLRQRIARFEKRLSIPRSSVIEQSLGDKAAA